MITLLHSTVFFLSLIFMVMTKGYDECQMHVTLQLFVLLKLEVLSRGKSDSKEQTAPVPTFVLLHTQHLQLLIYFPTFSVTV